MKNLMIEDMTRGEKLAFVTCLFIRGELSSNEYEKEVEKMSTEGETFEGLLFRATDWDCLNRMLLEQQWGAALI